MTAVRRGIVYKSCIKRGFIRPMEVDFDKAKLYLNNAKKWNLLSTKIYKDEYYLLVADTCFKTVYNIAQSFACVDGFNIIKTECVIKYFEDKYCMLFEKDFDLYKFNTILINHCQKDLYNANYLLDEKLIVDLLNKSNIIYQKSKSILQKKMG